MVREVVVGGKILKGHARQEAFDDCHVFRHWWKPTVVEIEGNCYVQHLVCMRCDGERTWKVNRTTGFPEGNRYDMADGYYYERTDEEAVKKNGRLRIQEIERNLAERAAEVTRRASASQRSQPARAASGRRR
jgi:hypothetical protein